jgi:hypothetical protein
MKRIEIADFFHGALGVIYAYVFGHRDSPLFLAADE